MMGELIDCVTPSRTEKAANMEPISPGSAKVEMRAVMTDVMGDERDVSKRIGPRRVHECNAASEIR